MSEFPTLKPSLGDSWWSTGPPIALHSLFCRADLLAKAVELEHAMFRNAKMANLYKASVLKKVGPCAGEGQTGHMWAQGRNRQSLPTPRALPRGCLQRESPFFTGAAGGILWPTP